MDLRYATNSRFKETRLHWRVFDGATEILSGGDDPTGLLEALRTPLRYQVGIDYRTEIARRAKKKLFSPDASREERRVKKYGTKRFAGKLPRATKAQQAASIIPTTRPDDLAARTVDTAAGTFGYLRLWTFHMRDGKINAYLNEVIRLLANELPREGLILDVRGNGVGYVIAAEFILQFLTPRRVAPEPTQFINTAATLELTRKDAGMAEWKDSTRAVAAGLEPEHRAPDLRGAFHPARPEGPAATRGRDPVTTTPPFQLSEIELDALLKRLHLPNMRRLYRHVAVQAEEAQWAYRDFLGFLVAEEVAHRTQTRLQRLTRKAGFPFLKTINDFDFTLQSTLRAALLGSFLTPDFVTDGRSLILQGKTGRGKTHLAVAIAYRAIQNGFEAGFTTAAHLIEDLANASQRGQLHEALPAYTQPHVLVVDEVGYLSYGPDAANVLYHVVNDRHLRKRPMIFTTNKPLTQWGRVLHDPDLAAAILDRVLERGQLLPLDGPSGRTRHLKLDQVFPEDAKDARISGSPGPEYPEPTNVWDWRRSRPEPPAYGP